MPEQAAQPPVAPQAPDVFARLRESTGPRYFHVVLLMVAAVIVLVVVPAYSLLLFPYFELTFAQYADTVVTFAVVMAAASAGLFAVLVRRHRAIVDWLRGSRGATAASSTWESVVVDLPRSMLLAGTWFAAWCVPPALYVADQTQLSLVAAVGYCLVLWFGVSGMVVPAYLVLEQALRPVVREAAGELPEDFEPARRPVALATKVLILLPVINLFTSIVVAMASSNSVSIEGRVVVTAATALAVTITVSLGLTLIFRRSLLVRLDDLSRAIRRVDRGDLTIRLPRVAGDELDEVGRTFNRMVSGLREREALHGALGSYVSADLVDRMAQDGGIVQGEEADVTVLFADIRGFTNVAEGSPAAQVVDYLNEFFALVLPIVTRHRGHPNKLLGDGLLAVFGAPIPDVDHADCAVAAAREIVAAVGDRYGDELRIGVGLSSGRVIAGTVGGPGKLDYTVIGDTVNVAARVEQLTKDTGDPLLMTEATRLRLRAPVPAASRGVQRIRGKAQGVEVHAVPVG